MKLNREQIVKALECCSVYETCDGCPHFNGVPEDDCHYKAMANALALIRELTEENERLRKTSEDVAECPICHGIGKIGTTNWLTKHLSKEQIAKEKAEAEAEFHRELRADTVRKMQERLKAEFKDCCRYIQGNREYFIVGEELIDQIAKEMLEEET